MENKQNVCDLLLLTLKAARIGSSGFRYCSDKRCNEENRLKEEQK